MTPESHTERGFAVYATLTDTYEQKVSVVKSSAAGEDCVWVFCDRPHEGQPGSPHLSVAQAREVRDALDEFITDYEEPPLGEGDRAVYVGPETEDHFPGSSGKVGEVQADRILVRWGGGFESWHPADEIVTAREAARRGVEPWASAFG